MTGHGRAELLKDFRSSSLAGRVSFASMAPGLAVSPPAGALLDRIGAAKAVFVDMAVSSALLLVLTIAGAVGAMFAPLLLTLAMLYSLTSRLGGAGIRTVIPNVVPKDALDRANALDTSSYAVFDVLSPALVGVVFGFAGPEETMFMIAFLYALASVSLAPLVRRALAHRSEPARPLIHEAIAGVAYRRIDQSVPGRRAFLLWRSRPRGAAHCEPGSRAPCASGQPGASTCGGTLCVASRSRYANKSTAH